MRVEMVTVETGDVPPLPEWGSDVSRRARLVPHCDSMRLDGSMRLDDSPRRESLFSALGLPRAAGRIEPRDDLGRASWCGLLSTAVLVLLFCAVPAVVTAGLVAVTFDEACFEADGAAARYAFSIGGGAAAGLLPAFVLWLVHITPRASPSPDKATSPI